MTLSAVAVIPARGGSRRIPRKNIRAFHGKPIIAYSIEMALACGLFGRVFVSTDSTEIADVAVNFGARPLIRLSGADDETGTQEVMAIVITSQISWLEPSDLVCCIYATAPMMTTRDLKRGERLFNRARLFTPPLHHQFAYAVGPDSVDAGQFYWGYAHAFRDRIPLNEETAVKIEIDAARVCDINTEADWQRAEAMYTALQPEVIA